MLSLQASTGNPQGLKTKGGSQSGKLMGELWLAAHAVAHIGNTKAGDFTATRGSEDWALQSGKLEPRLLPKSKTT